MSIFVDAAAGDVKVAAGRRSMSNPTSGFALFFREEEVMESGMTVEEAVKFVDGGFLNRGDPAAWR